MSTGVKWKTWQKTTGKKTVVFLNKKPDRLMVSTMPFRILMTLPGLLVMLISIQMNKAGGKMQIGRLSIMKSGLSINDSGILIMLTGI